jgi:hypothetical protein
MNAGKLTRPEMAVLEARVAPLSVRVADSLIDKAFHNSGVSWLRANGWTRPLAVETAADDEQQAVAS